MIDLYHLIDLHRQRLSDAGIEGGPLGDEQTLRRHVEHGLKRTAIEKRWVRGLHTVETKAGIALYPAPSDVVDVISFDWPEMSFDAFEHSPPPIINTLIHDGQKHFQFSPAPTARDVSAMGGKLQITYNRLHSIEQIGSESVVTTLDPADIHLVLLAALIEAARELANRAAHKPATLKDGAGLPGNMTNAALFERYSQEWVAAK